MSDQLTFDAPQFDPDQSALEEFVRGKTLEEIEAAIPDEKKNLSFGGPDEDILDVMDRMDEATGDEEDDS